MVNPLPSGRSRGGHALSATWRWRWRAAVLLPVLLGAAPVGVVGASQPDGATAGDPVLHDRVTLQVPGNSRYAALVSGRDTVRRHLQGMGVDWALLPRLSRLAPRDDGVQRTSLASQRNLRQVRALHGAGGAARFIAANGARVVVIVRGPGGRDLQLVQYHFDPSGRVASLRTATPFGPMHSRPCCNFSGTSETSAFTITPR